VSTRTHRDFLRTQLLEVQRLKALAGDHPIMSVSYRERETEIRGQIETLPLGQKEAKVVLFFSGEPVQGSQGIDALFAGKVLEPFQTMVRTQYADRWRGMLGSRGRIAGESQSRLLLTALPRGSFGLELTRSDDDELFAEDQLADTLADVARLIDASAKSDEDFAATLDGAPPRVVQNLKGFLEIVSKGKAGLQLESGDLRFILSPAQALEAFSRVSSTITVEAEVSLTGVCKGILLESWKFDFVPDDAEPISGRLDDDLTEDEATVLTKQYFNEHCRAALTKTTISFKNGRTRSTYRLKSLSSLSAP